MEGDSDQIAQLKKYGYWYMHDDSFIKDCYHYSKEVEGGYQKETDCNYKIEYFKGVVASSRTLRYGVDKRMSIFIGIGKHKYLEILVDGNLYFDSRVVMIEGYGIIMNNIYNTIQCKSDNIKCF